MITELQIRQRLAEIAKGVAPGAQCVERIIVDSDADRWAVMLQSPDDNNRIHTWQFGFAGVKAVERNGTRRIYRIGFDCEGYYGYRLGDASANSQAEFGAEIFEMVEAINADPRLGFSGESIKEVESLILPDMKLVGFGERIAHKIAGTITVRLYSF